MLGETQNQFALTRVALNAIGSTRSKFLLSIMSCKRLQLWFIALGAGCGLLAGSCCLGQSSYTENFETSTIFSGFSIWCAFHRSDLAGQSGVPNASPALHINQGGDQESYFNGTYCYGLAFAPGVYDDVVIDGYVATCSPSSFGDVSTGFILRWSRSGGYVAKVHSAGGSPRTGVLNVQQMVGGLLDSPFLALAIPDFDPLNEDYRVIFEAKGNRLTISLWKERMEDGQLKETYLGTTSSSISGPAFGQIGLYSTASYPRYSIYDDITVRGAAPAILAPPISQTAEAGSRVVLRCSVAGPPGQTCQWFRNTTTQVGEGSGSYTLTLTNLQTAQSGAYTLVVTNLFGSATSAPAMLNVITPVERHMLPAVTLTGVTGSLLSVESTDALIPSAGWTDRTTLLLTNASQDYFDASLPPPAARFYRARGDEAIRGRVIGVRLVPAIPIRGAFGTTHRLDYIKRFGPTDAWVTLATVTITNSPVIVFDTSAQGQPERLYRIVPLP